MSQALVTAIKNELLAAGRDLSGPCGAFAITKRVAWALHGTGAGLLAKPSGNNCDGYATDIVCYPDGRIRDILGDGGGANTPQWPEGELEVVDPARYRFAIDPGDAPTPVPPPVPTPVPPPPGGDLGMLLARLEAIDQRLRDISDRDDDLFAALKSIIDTLGTIQARQDRAMAGKAGFLGTVTLRPQG